MLIGGMKRCGGGKWSSSGTVEPRCEGGKKWGPRMEQSGGEQRTGWERCKVGRPMKWKHTGGRVTRREMEVAAL